MSKKIVLLRDKYQVFDPTRLNTIFCTPLALIHIFDSAMMKNEFFGYLKSQKCKNIIFGNFGQGTFPL